jgi:hypothetical protein
MRRLLVATALGAVVIAAGVDPSAAQTKPEGEMPSTTPW